MPTDDQPGEERSEERLPLGEHLVGARGRVRVRVRIRVRVRVRRAGQASPLTRLGISPYYLEYYYYYYYYYHHHSYYLP